MKAKLNLVKLYMKLVTLKVCGVLNNRKSKLLEEHPSRDLCETRPSKIDSPDPT
jgi:hypothetical protein